MSLYNEEDLKKLIMKCTDENINYPDPPEIKNKYAYVTLVMLGDLYISAAITLAFSLKKCGSLADLVVLVTPDVSEEGKYVLSTHFDHIILISYIDVPSWRSKHSKLYLSRVFTKFHVFNLVQYEKVILIDADALVLKHPDHIFTLNAPAGCYLKDKNLIITYDKEGNYIFPHEDTLEWYKTMCNCCGHGKLIPKEYTDSLLKHFDNPGIGGGLMLLKPDKKEYEDILQDIQKPNVKELIEKKFIWPEQQYLTVKYSGQWTGINPKFFGLQGYPHWKILYGLQYGGDKPFIIKSKFDIKTRILYPDFILWHDYYKEILVEHPWMLHEKSLEQANEMNKYFHTNVVKQKRLVSKLAQNINNKAIVQKIYKIIDVNREQLEYYHLDIDIGYRAIYLLPEFEDIKIYDYFEPIKRLQEYYEIYYDKLLNLKEDIIYSDRLDKYIKTGYSSSADQIMLEYIKSRPNVKIITCFPNFLESDLESFISTIAELGHIYYVKKINLNSLDLLYKLFYFMFDEITYSMRDIYIKEKIKNFNNANITCIFIDDSKNMNIVKSIKKMYYYNNYFITNYFYQSIEFAQYILHSNSLKYLKNVNIENSYSMQRETLKKWLYNNLSLLELGRIAIFDQTNVTKLNGIFMKFIDKRGFTNQTEIELLEFVYYNLANKQTGFVFTNIVEKHIDIITPTNYTYFNGLKIIFKK